MNAREFVWTMDQYDAVLIIDAPDDETVVKAAVAVAAQENLRTTTLRALSEQEMERVLRELQ